MSIISKKELEHLANLARMEIIKYGLKYNSILIFCQNTPRLAAGMMETKN